MKIARIAAVLALALLAGLISAEVQSLDLLRLLMERPVVGGHRWERRPGVAERLDHYQNYDGDIGSYNRELTAASSKRSAVATALNAGRPRRQPAPALGKAVPRFPGVGILNDMDTFFDALRGNLQGIASLTPDERANFYEPPNVVRPPASGLISAEVQSLDLLRLLMERPVVGGHRWERRPGVAERLDHYQNYDGDIGSYNRELTAASSKRSAVATALNAGRPRRQPAPALGKAVPRFPGVGILNDMDTFFDALRGNLQGIASLTPDERANFYEPPNVVRPPASGGGGGSGMRKLHALRPLRPTGNIRSYNRRSLVEDSVYPGANRHDPGLLWAGLGR